MEDRMCVYIEQAISSDATLKCGSYWEIREGRIQIN